MITIEMVLKYIKEHKHNPHNKNAPVCLTNPQIKFLENLCTGKITSVPRMFGKTWLIKMYCDCLDYYHDMEKYDDSIKVDKTISLKETMEGFGYYSVNPYSHRSFLEMHKENPEKFYSEYNATEDDIAWIKRWAEIHGYNEDRS